VDRFAHLRVEVDGAVGALVLDRPDANNSIALQTLQELEQAARWFDDQPAVRVVVVSGAGRWFSPGADLKAPPTGGSRNPETDWLERHAIGQQGTRAMAAIEGMRAVTIAKAHGAAVGGGFVLLQACDLRVVADDTILAIPEIALGIPLTWGAIPRLVREIGPALTKELLITCRRFSPAEAASWRLVNRVVPVADLDDTVDELVATIAGMPSVPVRSTKMHVNAVARAMAGSTDHADGDLLLGIGLDPESAAAAADYVARTLGPR
jgi:enoyl-CoA hydratase/carnithine racemase